MLTHLKKQRSLEITIWVGKVRIATGEEIYALVFPYGVYDSLSKVSVTEERIATALSSIRSSTKII